MWLTSCSSLSAPGGSNVQDSVITSLELCVLQRIRLELFWPSELLHFLSGSKYHLFSPLHWTGIYQQCSQLCGAACFVEILFHCMTACQRSSMRSGQLLATKNHNVSCSNPTHGLQQLSGFSPQSHNIVLSLCACFLQLCTIAAGLCILEQLSAVICVVL